jgi:hypothetical protein
LCLACADLDHLEYSPRGDAALTRRAGADSTLQARVAGVVAQLQAQRGARMFWSVGRAAPG